MRGTVRRVDAGETGGIRFNNGLGIGFDAQVAAGVADAPAYLGGFGGYLWSAGKLLLGLRCYEATLKLDGAEAVRSKTILVAVALGTTFGARFQLAPAARLDDGLFDVVWSEEVSRVEVLKLLPSAFDGTLLKAPEGAPGPGAGGRGRAVGQPPGARRRRTAPSRAQFQGPGTAGGSAGHRAVGY